MLLKDSDLMLLDVKGLIIIMRNLKLGSESSVILTLLSKATGIGQEKWLKLWQRGFSSDPTDPAFLALRSRRLAAIKS